MKDDDDPTALWCLADAPAPVDFTDRVMRRIAELQAPVPAQPARWHRLAQALVLIPTAALGASQVLGFLLGVWASSVAY